jgi:hypothetical protein
MMEMSSKTLQHQLAGCPTNNTTVPFHSIRQSRVTGLPKSAKCHDCHGHLVQVTKTFLDTKKNYINFNMALINFF